MPYDPDSPPAKLRGLSSEKQRQFCHVFNSCYEKHGDDAKCSRMAWGVTGGWKESKEYDLQDRDIDLETELIVKGFIKSKKEDEISESLGTKIILK